MLIIGGSAEYVGETDKFTQGNSHAFTMFCSNEDLDAQLKAIETFFNERDWDQISIDETQLIEDSSVLNHETLKQAYDKANVEGISVVIQDSPLSDAA